MRFITFLLGPLNTKQVGRQLPGNSRDAHRTCLSSPVEGTYTHSLLPTPPTCSVA